MQVPFVVEVADAVPSNDLTQWGQMNECSLDVASGRLVIDGCTDYFPDAARTKVPPLALSGPYLLSKPRLAE